MCEDGVELGERMSWLAEFSGKEVGGREVELALVAEKPRKQKIENPCAQL